MEVAELKLNKSEKYTRQAVLFDEFSKTERQKVDFNSPFLCSRRNFMWRIKIAPSLRLSIRLSICLSVHNKSCVSLNSKTDGGHLIKLHRKINQNQKVCHTQNLGSHDQGQGHNQRSKVCHLQILCQP